MVGSVRSALRILVSVEEEGEITVRVALSRVSREAYVSCSFFCSGGMWAVGLELRSLMVVVASALSEECVMYSLRMDSMVRGWLGMCGRFFVGVWECLCLRVV